MNPAGRRLPSMRIDAPWLREPSTQAVFEAIEGGGFAARAVGGIVRNCLLGLKVTDIDIATTALPADTMRLAERAGLKAIPTGLAHGTITVVSGGVPFEVTTLRRDVATDGRHAEVAFTDDWAADAARRDFTINALYCDRHGSVFDPLGGTVDLAPVRVRFIGAAETRITEDYLRILRFFRFSASFSADSALDAAGLAACAKHKDGLARISGERIQAELLKLLAARHGVAVTGAMIETGVFAAITGAAPDAGRLARLAHIEGTLRVAADPVLRLAALAVSTAEDAMALNLRLKLSAHDRERLSRSVRNGQPARLPASDHEARVLAYRLGPPACRDGLLLAWTRSRHATDDALLAARIMRALAWTPPAFPLSGADVVALGVAAGPTVGTLLARVEADWLASDFTLDRVHLLDRLRAHAEAAGPAPKAGPS